MMKGGNESLFSEVGTLFCSMFFRDAEVCMLFIVGREEYRAYISKATCC